MRQKYQLPSFREAAAEAVAEINATIERGGEFTRRSVVMVVKPRSYGPNAVRATRAKLRLSQPLFAAFLGTNPKTVESWEQGRRIPSPMARRFMDELNRSPEHWQCVLGKSLTGAK
jgi:DNA-binding transcriptional regulator YiaG